MLAGGPGGSYGKAFLFSEMDARFMRMALQLARKNRHRVSPNPQVGCVIVSGGTVVGQGWHDCFGGAHAEAVALSEAGAKAKGATAYVTLEPCGHTRKKTPPCAPALVKAGIRRVVASQTDPNPNVSGKGFAAMAKAGVAVDVGLFWGEARFLNRAYAKFITTKNPWVTLKLAQTLDGRITASTRLISNAQSRAFVQTLRAGHDAVLVGKNTVLADNPVLSCRLLGWPDQPLRVILDARLETPLSARVYASPGALVACTKDAPQERMAAFRNAGVTVAVCGKGGRVHLPALMADLGRNGIASVLVEGGGAVASTFMEEELVDEGYFFVAPFFSGNGIAGYHGKERRFGFAEALAFGGDACLHVLRQAVEPSQNQEKRQ